MFIYNVTVNVDDSIMEDWLSWMKLNHIPDVMATGFFREYRISRVMVEEESGETFSIQYTVDSLEQLKAYQHQHAPRLQKEVKDRYGDRFVAFRTIMEVLQHGA
jgi:hypothetical protein